MLYGFEDSFSIQLYTHVYRISKLFCDTFGPRGGGGGQITPSAPTTHDIFANISRTVANFSVIFCRLAAWPQPHKISRFHSIRLKVETSYIIFNKPTAL